MSSDYISSLFSLQDKTAIVTGATGGLGSAMTCALVKAGVSTIISIEIPNDSSSAELKQQIEGIGGKVIPYHCDLRDNRSIRTCYESIWAAGVEPDILLNCAGIMRRNKCEVATEEELDALFDVNAKSTYLSMQEFGRRLIALGRPGKIINVASVTAFNAGFNTSVYSSTKGAVLQMTKAFSNEWASKNIQVNCICPGFMMTPMTAQYRDNQQMTDYLMTRVPAARWGQPQDLEPAVVFLASPANSFLTGASLVVDGGFCGK